MLEDRERQVARLHENIRGYVSSRQDQDTLRKNEQNIKREVESRFYCCKSNQQYQFPREEASSSDTERPSLEQSVYNLFEQNEQGRLYDEVLFPEAGRTLPKPNFKKAAPLFSASLERGRSHSKKTIQDPRVRVASESREPTLHDLHFKRTERIYKAPHRLSLKKGSRSADRGKAALHRMLEINTALTPRPEGMRTDRARHKINLEGQEKKDSSRKLRRARLIKLS